MPTAADRAATLVGTRPAPLVAAHEAYRDELLAGGLLVGTGVEGLYGRGAAYERVCRGVRHAIAVCGRRLHGDAVTELRFPPVFPRDAYEKTGYIASFPHLTGVLFTFEGGDAEHRALLADREAALPWDHHLTGGDTVLVSAACHPSYARLSGTTLPVDGAVVAVDGWCFRHEPSPDPLRMQAFSMAEFIRLGTPEQAAEHRSRWTAAAARLLEDLGLEPRPVAANDPFFGRAGRLLVNNQRHENLKTELVVRLYGDLDPEGTALFSANDHLDHFGGPFDITVADGRTAHSACVGFGVDRIALSLLRIHGLDVDGWPVEVRSALGETGGRPHR